MRDLGDEAWVARGPVAAEHVSVVARRANVWVTVDHLGDGSDPDTDPKRHRSAVLAVARSALAAVRLD